MAKRNKLVHLHSNVYTGGAPKAPTSGTLDKGEIAVNYNDTEPALFIENNSGGIVKFNAIQRSEISAITDDISNIQTNINTLSDAKITLNGAEKSLTANTTSFYAPTDSGVTGTILSSNGANQSPAWIEQSAITAGNAAQADKTAGALTLSGNGTTLVTFNGSADTGVNITYTSVGAAAASHNHAAGDLPTASTDAYGVVKVGTTSGTVAAGDHTHSEYENPSVVDKNATWAWGEKVTAATVGETAITITSPALPTPASIGAAASTHSHTSADLPTASTSAYGMVEVGDFLSVSNGVVSVATGTSSSTVAKGDHEHNYAASDSAGGAANSTKGSLTINDKDGNALAVFDGSSDTAITLNYTTVGAAAASHQHSATDLPVATDSSLGVVQVGDFLTVTTSGTISVATGTSANTVAKGSHTHKYAGSSTVGGAANSTQGSLTINDKDGNALVEFNGSESSAITLDYTTVGAAAASHDHSAEDLPTASTEAFGIVKVGTASGTVAAGDHTHSEYVNPTVTDNAATWEWNDTVTVATIGNTAITITSPALPTPSNIGAAASTHSHTATDLPTATTGAYGIVQIGTTSGTVATGDHTHSEYVNPTVTDKNATWSWGEKVTAATIGNTAITITAPALPSAADVGAAASSHTHTAADLPTASTSAYGMVEVGDFLSVTNGVVSVATGTTSATVAKGDHVHNYAGSSSAGGAANSVAGTLSVSGNGTSIITYDGSTGVSVNITPTTVGAAAAEHEHDAGDLPTASTADYGIVKVGTDSGTVAAGDHTHSEYVNPTVTDNAATWEWNDTVTVATVGSTAITITSPALPTPSDIGAAASTHSHTATDLPTATTGAYGVVQLGTTSGTAAEGDHTHSEYVNPTVTNKSATWAWNSTVTAATIGSTAITVTSPAMPTPTDIGAATSVHSHTAGQLPTASTSAYGMVEVGDFLSVTDGVVKAATGTTSSTLARGDHDHYYAGSNSVGGAANSTAGKLTIKNNEGTTVAEFNGSSDTSVTITYQMVGAAAATHNHDAANLPTASTSAYGMVQVGSGLKVTNGIISADTGTTAGTVAAGDHTHSYAGSSSVGGAANSTQGSLTIKDVNNTTLAVFNGSANTSVTLSYSTVGAAASAHTHEIGDLPTATTVTSDSTTVPTTKAVKDYVDGLVVSPVNYKGAITNGTLPASADTHIGDMYIVQTTAINLTTATSATGAAQTAETGDYIIARSSGKWDVMQKNLTGAVTSSDDLTDGKIILGAGSQTVKVSNYTPSSFAESSHTHGAGDLPTATTSAYGMVEVGDFLSVTNGVVSVATGATSSTVAKGDHTHSYAGSSSAGGAANSTAGKLTIKDYSGTTVAEFNGSADSAVTITHTMAGAAAATHTHSGSDITSGVVPEADKIDGYHILVVTEMPVSPAADTIYILK